MEQEWITISIKEYKELLIIKGKYEELKSYTIPALDTNDYKVACCSDNEV